MCQPKPGVRCAGYTRGLRDRARAQVLTLHTDLAVAVALAGTDADPRVRLLRRDLARVQERLRAREAAWDATPAGRAWSADRDVPGTVAHADALAGRLHAGQVDKLGVPYHAGHVRQVAGLVRAAGGTDLQVIAALLHDTVEDVTRDGGERLRAEQIPEPSVRIVLACTHDDNEPYDVALARVVAGGPDAIGVKLADLGSNTDPRRGEALLQVRVAAARARAAAAGRDPAQAEADTRRGDEKRVRRYLDAAARLRAELARAELARTG